MYDITIRKGSIFNKLEVVLSLPRKPPVRYGEENSVFLGVTADGINIPATGTLHSDDMPHFLKALSIAESIAAGTLHIEGLTEEELHSRTRTFWSLRKKGADRRGKGSD